MFDLKNDMERKATVAEQTSLPKINKRISALSNRLFENIQL